jgi:hypothetical protein
MVYNDHIWIENRVFMLVLYIRTAVINLRCYWNMLQ